MTLPDDLLIDGTALRSIPGLVVEDLSGLHAPGTRRGDNIVYPGRKGEVRPASKPRAAYTFDVPVTLLEEAADGSIPSTAHERRATFLATLRAVQELCDTDAVLALTRRLAVAGDTYEDMTADGEYIAGLAIALLNDETGKTILTFKNLDGEWYDDSEVAHL